MKSAIAIAKRLYSRAGIDLAADIGRHLEFGGVVHCEPRRILLARPIELSAPNIWPLPGAADAWFITLAIGQHDFAFFVQLMPWFLPNLAWRREFRGDRRMHIQDTAKFINFNRRFH